MIKLDIPGRGIVEIDNVIFDYNGTIALDGKPVEGIYSALDRLSFRAKLFIVTADTFGTVREYFADSTLQVIIVDSDCGTRFKKEFINSLDSSRTAAIGNGRNDTDMLDESCLSISVMGREGCCTGALLKSDIIVASPVDAVELLLNPERIKATLRY